MSYDQDTLTAIGSKIFDRLNTGLMNNQYMEASKHIVESIIYDMSNPNPIYVVILTLSIMVLAYMLYKLYIMPNLNDVWIDSTNKTYVINHNRITGEIEVMDRHLVVLVGSVHMNAVSLQSIDKSVKLHGYWDLKNKITFLRDRGDLIGSVTSIWLRVR